MHPVRTSVLCVALICSTAAVVAQVSDDATWQSFVKWFEAVPADSVGTAREIVDAYRAKLRGEGVPEGAVSAAVEVIQKRFRSLEWQRLSYNRAYEMTAVPFKVQPNALVVDVASGLTPGMALDVAMGQGRNAVYLAQQGWRVTGFDIADEGVKIASAAAKRLGLTLNAVRATNADFEWGTAQWDLIVVTYSPFEGPIERALKPGGTLIIEAFLWDPTERGGAPKPDGVAGPNDLLEAFPSLRVLRYEDTMAVPDWGDNLPTRLVRLVARKQN